MRIRTSKRELSIYEDCIRPDGRRSEHRICKLDINTTGENLPPELIDNLSPKNLRAVKELLGQHCRAQACKDADALCGQIEATAAQAAKGYLDTETLVKLRRSVTSLLNELKRRSRVGNEIAGSNLGFALDEIQPSGISALVIMEQHDA